MAYHGNGDDTQIIDPREVRYQAERRRRIIKARARKKKKRRQFMFFTGLTLIIIVLILVLVQVFAQPSKKVQATGGMWYLRDSLGVGKQVKRYASLEDKSNAPRDQIRQRIQVSLVQGQNHISKAQHYAYDTKLVRDYIQGKASYEGPGKLAFLTFDDGPSDQVTTKILDVLKAEGVPATFFIQGRQVSQNKQSILMRELAEGHGIAMHSYTHDYQLMYPGRSGNTDQIIKEAKTSQDHLSQYLPEGFYSGVWRYPGGHMSWANLEAADEGLSSLGIQWIDWNVMTGDADRKSIRPTNIEETVSFLNKEIESSSHPEVIVVLMHDSKNKELTAESLPSVIKSLKSQGYNFGILK
ncbi:MAG: polysaccharide deacetylase family protein [Tissierellia bacterium]|nr:polysaccharide deacetylase family protein [Tissierellia bacterium]